MTLKIAFGGKMGAGKDHAAQYLQHKYGGIIMKFADPLYDIMHHAQKICNFPIEKDRKFLQYIGTEWARGKDPDVWVNNLLTRVHKIDTTVYITDLRYPNELEALKANDWVCINLIRPHVSNREGTGSIFHSSETSLPDGGWDYIIHNTETIDNFNMRLDEIYMCLSKQPHTAQD